MRFPTPRSAWLRRMLFEKTGKVHFSLNTYFVLRSLHKVLSEFHLHAGKILTVKVLMDSNFLLVPSQFKLDIFEELNRLLNQKYYPIIISTMYGELKRLSERGSPTMRRRALMALNLAGKCEMFQVEEKAGEVHDDVVVRVANEWNCLVATNDRELRKRLRNINIPVIYLRQKCKLEIEGPLP